MHPTASELTTLLRTLNEIKADAKAGIFNEYRVGICAVLAKSLYKKLIDMEENHRFNLSIELRDWVMQYVASWSDYSGCVVYPIPQQHTDQFRDVSYFMTASDKELWKGNQLSLRISLLNHLIQCVNKELQNASK